MDTNEVKIEEVKKTLPCLDDILSKDRLQQIEEDMKLDGGPGFIPDWSKYYKGNKQNKIDKDNI